MKHNEVKAYFKNKLKERLVGYDVLSIDETLSARNLYIVDKETLRTKMLITAWFGTNDFHVKGFLINENSEVNKYKDHIIEVRGSYLQLAELGDMITAICVVCNNKGHKDD